MHEIAAGHEAHGYLPLHLLEEVAAGVGVAARSLEHRYSMWVAGLAGGSPWRLGPDERAVLAAAPDLPAGLGLLDAVGRGAPYAVVDRALWGDVSRGLVRLRVAERRRRQRLSEAPWCASCGAGAASAAAA